ncbi:MAG: DUF4870 domain-containing protein [Candidatus Omnitrophica bacterium]|nr:DUF4870 domain-containing protein [Candidatus Omnitrophota bacterium]HOX54589.1 DUF4870 domain-containing protein [Candidatus Omnitrophota bacterium]
MAKDLGKTSTGIEPNVAALLSYVVGWVTGLIFFLIEKDNKFVRFHALQSIIVFGGLTAAMIILSILLSIFFMVHLYFFFPLFRLINLLLWLLGLILWIVLMIKAYQGEYFKVPIAGDIADKKK